MFGSGSKPSLGLSINTTPATGASATSQPPGASLFAGLGSGTTSQPAQQGGLFANATSSQPTQTGGLFGSASSQTSQTGGLFGSASSQPTQTGGLFGSAPSQSSQTGGLFGSTPSQSAAGGLFGATTTSSAGSGLFATAASNPTQSGGILGSNTSHSASGGGLFGNPASQPGSGTGLFGQSSQATSGGGVLGTASTQAPASSLFGAASTSTPQAGLGGNASQPGQGLFGGLNQSGPAKSAGSLNLGQQPTLSASTSGTRIDLDHLRPTTKFDQLTEDLQKEILGLDTAILNEISRCHEVSNLLPAIATAGANIPNDVAYVSEKLEEVEMGLENDAEDIQNLKEQIVKKDASEAKVCFREVDRLKMPSQYQASITNPTTSVSSGFYGGHGLSGWWNHPQTLQRTVRGRAGGGGGGGGIRALQLPGDEEDGVDGPANLVDLFERRTEQMRQTLVENKSLLTQVEDFVATVEGKIAMKQREVMGQEEGRLGGIQDEDELGLLRYVFGEFERSLYEVADRVGATRDGVQELVLGSAAYQGQF